MTEQEVVVGLHDVGRGEMGHDEMGHGEMVHGEMVHDEMVHDEMGHGEVGPDEEGAGRSGGDGPGRRVRAAIEAVLMVADEPVAAQALARATGEDADEVDLMLRELAGQYGEEGRGFELREVGGGWRMFSRAEHADVVEAFLLDGQTAKLTQAALETLAIVAYRQPVSRSRVSAVRGVSVDGVMRTLLTRGLVTEAGVEVSSGATLYRTTGEFLQRMGLESLEDLPALAPFLPDELGVEDLELPEVLAVAVGARSLEGGLSVDPLAEVTPDAPVESSEESVVESPQESIDAEVFSDDPSVGDDGADSADDASTDLPSGPTGETPA
ncbi:MAG: SMC-Scp complex subunit ScpB, partial [Janthinobacterium lividum]